MFKRKNTEKRIEEYIKRDIIPILDYFKISNPTVLAALRSTLQNKKITQATVIKTIIASLKKDWFPQNQKRILKDWKDARMSIIEKVLKYNKQIAYFDVTEGPSTFAEYIEDVRPILAKKKIIISLDDTKPFPVKIKFPKVHNRKRFTESFKLRSGIYPWNIKELFHEINERMGCYGLLFYEVYSSDGDYINYILLDDVKREYLLKETQWLFHPTKRYKPPLHKRIRSQVRTWKRDLEVALTGPIMHEELKKNRNRQSR